MYSYVVPVLLVVCMSNSDFFLVFFFFSFYEVYRQLVPSVIISPDKLCFTSFKWFSGDAKGNFLVILVFKSLVILKVHIHYHIPPLFIFNSQLLQMIIHHL